MRTLLAVALLLVVGCGAEGNTWPDVETLYSTATGDVVCDGAVSITPETDRVTCAWERVRCEGLPRCYVIVVFDRSGTGGQWGTAAVFPSSATCD